MRSVDGCWNAFCVATYCDGVEHVDVLATSWSQAEGTAYNPATAVYDRPDTETVNGVWTDYRRD